MRDGTGGGAIRRLPGGETLRNAAAASAESANTGGGVPPAHQRCAQHRKEDLSAQACARSIPPATHTPPFPSEGRIRRVTHSGIVFRTLESFFTLILCQLLHMQEDPTTSASESFKPPRGGGAGVVAGDKYYDEKDALIDLEEQVLRSLSFQTTREPPHKFLFNICAVLRASEALATLAAAFLRRAGGRGPLHAFPLLPIRVRCSRSPHSVSQ